ncbi:MAG: peroxiredoxin [Euryarchaeota archaeon]|nr:peroxiredoxin [Euryarchaeota archaeon]|tara:strand:- start:2057 stop:2518 length:462 start_codon:yes stop_codon:yes gene_type:complete
MVSVGDNAPDFTLMTAQDRSMVTLSEIGKRVVLAFYPAAFTGVCAAELCNFTDSMGVLNEADAEILGISADNVFANKEFAEAKGIGFPLLCDVKRLAIEAYGLSIHDFGAPGYTASQRAIFIVEPDGTIGYSWVAENPGIEPDYDAVVSFCST